MQIPASPLILIIDDEEPIRRMFARALTRWNYRTTEAADGIQGLQAIAGEQPDLVLLDLRMPRSNGFEVLSQLGEQTNQLPVVVISGNAEIEDALEALRRGAWDFLLKPLDDLNRLRHTVARALEWRSLKLQSLAYQTELEVAVAKRTQELRELSAHLQDIREEEKRHIAKEVHDELGVTLTALSMDISWLQKQLPEGLSALQHKVAGMKELINDAVQTSRRIISDLRPSVLDNLGLVAAMEWQARQFTDHYGIQCRVDSQGDDQNLSDATRIATFRIFQESLTNVAKHALAHQVSATLLIQHQTLILDIHDDGCGFNPDQVALTSHGLRGMRERVRQREGTLHLESHPGQGTCVSIRLPLQREEFNP
ncbi:MAG TPA: response regulator [Motiliproteus sp.]